MSLDSRLRGNDNNKNMQNLYFLLILPTIFLVASLPFGLPSYLFYRKRGKELAALAKEFGMNFESNSSIWSFLPILRSFYWDGGTVRRHIISGSLSRKNIVIYDSFNFLQTDFVALFLFNKLIKRSLIVINHEVMGELTPRSGFASIDQLRDILKKIKQDSILSTQDITTVI